MRASRDPAADRPIEHEQDMRTLNVQLGDRSYPIHIGAGLLSQPELIASHVTHKRAAIVTNTTVAPLYLEPLTKGLQAHRVQTIPIVVPDGEAHKTWETLNTIFDALLEHRCERNALC